MSIKPPPSSSSLPSAGDGGDDTLPESGDSSSTETRLQQHEKPTLQEPPAKRAGLVPEELGEHMDNMQKHFRCLFQYHSLAIGSSLNPLLDNTKEQQPTLDLSFLEPLKIKDSLLSENFFPDHNTLYVRKCMRDIFQLFCDDVEKKRDPEYSETVLIGSPGVGKSLLFFLGALYMAQNLMQPRNSHVIYCRRTKRASERVSVFIMTPNEKTGGVHVLFTRSLWHIELGNGLMSLFQFLHRNSIVREKCYVFIDGPSHDDRENTLHGGCDYLCTASGHPDFKSEQQRNRMWVLDGWSKDEAIDGLHYLGHKKSLAAEAYHVCGGNIHLMLDVCNGKDQRIKHQLDIVTEVLKKSYIALAFPSTVRKFDFNIPDISWTMFRDKSIRATKRMHALQVVDSSYVLHRLCECLDMEPFLKAYELSKRFKVEEVQSLYFKCIIHQWFLNDSKRADSSSPIQEVCFSTGTTVEGMCQLSIPNMYWVPSVSNFANIDSALVLNNTLFAFQMTVQASHEFDETSFESSLVKPVKEAFQNQLGGKGITQVVVVFIVPIPENELTLPKSSSHSIVEFLAHQVIPDSIDTISCSMYNLLEKLLAKSN
jgi:hypothetical protein